MYMESVLPGEHFMNIYKAHPFLYSCQAKKKGKKLYLVKQTLGAADQNLMCIHNLTLGVTWAGPHQATSLPLCVSG